MKALILGLGNPILGDDAVGLKVTSLARERVGDDPEIEVDEEHRGELRLMERLVGYDRAILVDAIYTGADPPGTILRLGPGDVPTQHTASAHDVNLPTRCAWRGSCASRCPTTSGLWPSRPRTSTTSQTLAEGDCA